MKIMISSVHGTGNLNDFKLENESLQYKNNHLFKRLNYFRL